MVTWRAAIQPRRRPGWRQRFQIVLLLCTAACGGVATQRPSPVPASSNDGSVWVDSVIATLSLRDRAAQLVWPWILSDYVSERSAEWSRIARLVREDHVGGFILSVGSPLDIAAKANALQRLSALPLLMSADMETGAGFRARAGFFVPNGIDLGGATVFPSQMALGASRDTALAYAFGLATAREARALGIPVVFGPVLDVNNNPANPVIGARSFAEDPQLAARLGVATIRGLQDGGVLATGKHFPGHGDTETNSHLALSVVTASRARLDSVELLPFRAAIAANVGAIMTFHGFLPALDSSGVPATLSPRVMTGLLRHELGFQGLLVTDAMDMRGVVDKFGAAEAATMAIAAGNDVLLMPANVPAAIDAVIKGVQSGRYTEDRLNQSVRRVLTLKARFGLVRDRFVSVEGVRAIVGDSMNLRLADSIAQRSIVLAKDSSALVPLGGNGTAPKVAVITYARRTDLSAGTTLISELRRGLPHVTSTFVSADDEDPRFETPMRMADAADVVVVCSYVNITSETATALAPRAFADFVSGLISSGRRVVLVSLGTPYLLQQVPSVSTYVVGWGGSPASQRAVARALLGSRPISGTLPIAIPPILPIGAGIVRQVSPQHR
ncbi:MAG: Beta-hexosaminidase [Gemmatimonadaceae bacterium]|nr:Beta-hexosaminidase [Gemmatimonadaceae bacterium]